RPRRGRQPLVHHGSDLIGEPAGLAWVVGDEGARYRQATLGGVTELDRLVLGEGVVGGVVQPPREGRDDPTEALPGLPRGPEPPLVRYVLGEAKRTRPPVVHRPDGLQRDLVVAPGVPVGVDQPPRHALPAQPGDQRDLLREIPRVATHHRYTTVLQLGT